MKKLMVNPRSVIWNVYDWKFSVLNKNSANFYKIDFNPMLNHCQPT